MAKTAKNKTGKDTGKDAKGGTIALNRRARHDYHLDQRFEAGLALQGWELKAIRAGRANITEAYAHIRGGEIFLLNVQITPLISASTHVIAEERRSRKLLLHRREIEKLTNAMSGTGLTIVPLQLYFKDGKAKVEIGVAKGKKAYDKRQTLRERQDQRETDRALSAARRRQG